MRPAIRNADDLLAIEAAGLDAFWTYRTPFAILEAQAKADPDAVAILYLRDGAGARTDRLTYGELARGVRRAANLFRRLGLDQDRSVAILMPQGIQGQIALWGAELAGRAFPVNPMLRPDHLATLARAAQARLAVVLGRNDEIDYWSAATSALRDAGCVTHILAGDADAPTDGADGDFADLCSREDGERLTFTPDERPETIAACFHTGGTTGAPKLALHSKGNQAFVASAASAMYAMHAGDVIVNGFPIFHVAGSFVYGLCAIAAGATQVIPTRLGMRTRGFVDDLWRHIERNRVTILGCVPTIMSALNSIPCNADIGSLRMSLTGGSALPGELARAFEAKTGKPVRNLLGMTECAGVVTVEPFHGERCPGSTGLRLPFTQVRAFALREGGADLAAPCAADETGVIALRGPNVAPGYTDPAKNAGTFEQGWLVSGDLGHVDAQGRVFVTGRAKDVIIRGAHNIDPQMIEEALLRHPAVAVAAAVGRPDSYAGELPVAFVSLKPGAEVTGHELVAFVAPLVAEPAAAPKSVTILPEIPLTPIGKMFKPALRAIATRAAIGDALRAAGLRDGSWDVEGEGSSWRIAVADAAAVAARDATVGMPLAIEIVAR